MKEPNWLLIEAVVAFHKRLIAEHGGNPEIRDPGLLESALSRPVNRLNYDPQASLFDLAASYAFGLSSNHPFIDGNKRIAFTAIAMFLGDNGYRFMPDKGDALQVILALASGEVDEPDLARWIEANAEPA
ncbi:MAG: type II toxin-antitoxin system death-on-curing family toxin [Rhodospirillales bacterium]|jgi:death-on-curing protein|nr:type II toxin-antitoxin system death-on-curing family toxin [Rhodospirillales bacterium]MDP6774626.1 type II toxin-antitoxin system death-on-curing family toxin [Rhodospirillales bacterium]